MTTHPTPPILFGMDEAAERLGITPRMMRRLVETRQITFRRVGRLIKLTDQDLAEYVERNKVEART